MSNRRAFLTSLAAAAGAMAVGGVRTQAMEPQGPFVPGLQLYTLRNRMRDDLAGTLAEVARIGYREVEFAGYFGRSPAEIRDLLREHGLSAPSTHVGFNELRDGWPRTLEAAKTAGHTFVTVPSIPGSARRTVAEWKDVARLFNDGAAAAQAAGLRFAYHNHDFEFTAIEGVVPYELLLAETDPARVSFQLDVYWAFRAGRDPVALLNAHPDRFTMLHVKDSAGPPAHTMVDVGAGVVDWRMLLPRAAALGVRHAFVEHDNPADPLASVRASHAYLARLQG